MMSTEKYFTKIDGKNVVTTIEKNGSTPTATLGYSSEDEAQQNFLTAQKVGQKMLNETTVKHTYNIGDSSTVKVINKNFLGKKVTTFVGRFSEPHYDESNIMFGKLSLITPNVNGKPVMSKWKIRYNKNQDKLMFGIGFSKKAYALVLSKK